MKYKEAQSIGEECGLEDPAEHVNNIIMHVTSLFAYAEIDGELSELTESAKQAGVRFSDVCGHAVYTGDWSNEPCYVCRKFGKLMEGGVR